MKDPVRILVAVEAGLDPESVETVLALEPSVQIVSVSESLDGDFDKRAEEAAELLVVACGGYSDRVISYIEGNVKAHPDRPVVVLCDGPMNGFVRRVFEAGADDMVTLPGAESRNGAATAQIVFTIEKAIARRQAPTTTRRTVRGGMICVLGPKGGIGKTLTATNLGVALASEGYQVALVDLDLQFGDAALALGIAPGKTVYDLATSSGTLDAEKLEAYLATHESGLRMLVAPKRPDQATAVGVDFLREVYALMRRMFDYVVVDTPPGFTPEVIASIDSSSDICMIGMLDSLSLKNTRLGLETLDLMGYESDSVMVVLNRADSRVGITREDVTQILGRPPDVLVPSHRDIARHVNAGKAIVSSSRRSEAAKAFLKLAHVYETEGHAAHKPSALRRLVGRKG
jgi:pilus assembly protein CpaE